MNENPVFDREKHRFDWHVVRMDDSRFWREGFLPTIGVEATFTFYIFDKGRHVFCCEMTPSYELWRATDTFDGPAMDDDAKRERAYEAIMEAAATEEPVVYMQTRDIDRRSPDTVRKLQESDANAALEEALEDLDDPNATVEDVYRKTIEKLIEHDQANTFLAW